MLTPPKQPQQQVANHDQHSPFCDSGFVPQRYLVNDTFFGGASAGAPVFLLVGGEFRVEQWWYILAEAIDVASQVGALVVALEHRYSCTSSAHSVHTTQRP